MSWATDLAPTPVFRVETDEDHSRITVSGRLDIAGVRRLKDELARATDEPVRRIVLDLTAVTFMDAVACGAVLGADSACAQAGQVLEVMPPRDPLLSLLGSRGRLQISDAVN
jgi:anti-anti-sigma factor